MRRILLAFVLLLGAFAVMGQNEVTEELSDEELKAAYIAQIKAQEMQAERDRLQTGWAGAVVCWAR